MLQYLIYNLIGNFINNKQVDIYTLNTYYDGSDHDEPIKQSISDSYYLELDTNTVTVLEIKVEPEEIKFLNGTSRTVYNTESTQKNQW